MNGYAFARLTHFFVQITSPLLSLSLDAVSTFKHLFFIREIYDVLREFITEKILGQ